MAKVPKIAQKIRIQGATYLGSNFNQIDSRYLAVSQCADCARFNHNSTVNDLYYLLCRIKFEFPISLLLCQGVTKIQKFEYFPIQLTKI